MLLIAAWFVINKPRCAAIFTIIRQRKSPIIIQVFAFPHEVRMKEAIPTMSISSEKVVTARIDTLFKQNPVGSQDLEASEKVLVKAGTRIPIRAVSPDRYQHVKLQLLNPLLASDGSTSLSTVYAYQPHVQIEGLPQAIKLAVRYRGQTDNDWHPTFGNGYRQCNLTSCTMLADFLLAGELTRAAAAQGLKEPESVYQKLLAKYGDTTDHNCQTRALKDLGIDSYYTQQTLTADDLLLSLRQGIPVVIGMKYKTGGHIVLLVGCDPDRQIWLVHDPFGTRHGASDSYDIGIGGAFDEYSYDTFDRLFWDRGAGSGDGRIVTSVKGKPTGLRAGL